MINTQTLKLFAVTLASFLLMMFTFSIISAKDTTAFLQKQSQNENEVKVLIESFYDFQFKFEVTDIIYDAKRTRFIASVPELNAEIGPSLIPIEYPSMEFGTPILLESNARFLEITDDTLYLNLFETNEIGSIAQIDLNNDEIRSTFKLEGPLEPVCYEMNAIDMVLLEEQLDSIAVLQAGRSCLGTVIYDNGEPRPDTTFHLFPGSTEIEPSEVISKLYGYNGSTSDFGFSHLIIDENGVHEEQVIENLISGYSTKIKYFDGKIYTSNGLIVDPNTSVIIDSFETSYPIDVQLNPETNRAFFISTAANLVEVYELDSLQKVGQARYPSGYDKLKKSVLNEQGRLIIMAKISNQHTTSLIQVVEQPFQFYVPTFLKNYCKATIDDFSINKSGWPETNDNDVTYQIIDGEYRFYHRTKGAFGSSTRGDIWYGSQRVEVNGRVISGKGSWGLSFGIVQNGQAFRMKYEINPSNQKVIISQFSSEGNLVYVDEIARHEIIPNSAQNKLAIRQVFYRDSQTQELISEINIDINDQNGIITTQGSIFGAIELSSFAESNNTEIRFDDYLFVGKDCIIP